MLMLSFLGAPQLTLHTVPISSHITGKALALFSYLAVTGRPHTRDVLANLLWSELSPQQARNNLRYVLPDLRKMVDDYLLITPQSISFNRQTPYWLDVEIVQTTLLKSTTISTQALQAALDLYHGEFLAGFSVRNAPVFEEWVMSQREELQTLMLQGLYTLAERYHQQGETQAGLATTQRLLRWEPWHEAGHRLQMQLLAVAGQRSAALAQYTLFRNMLTDELDAEPELATTALYNQLRSGKSLDRETSLQSDSGRESTNHPVTLSPLHSLTPPPPHPLPQLPHNLLGQLTPFIGRDAELNKLYTVFNGSDHRLVTLTGLGGVGKTRLALAVAQRILDFGSFQDKLWGLDSNSPPVNNLKSKDRAGSRQNPKFPDGVWFVSLTEVESGENLADRLATAIIEALQAPRSGPIAPVEQLVDYLRDRRLLLILDNFEHLRAGTDFLQSLVQQTTTVTVLVTSRAILNLPTEYVWPLTGLAAPQLDSSASLVLADTLRYDAIALFAERAQRASRTFRLDQTNQHAILQICHFVEGLPLGIELAAAMTRHYSCHQIWQTLQQDYTALAATLRDLSPRHRTLKTMLDYSWRFLTVEQGHVLAACALFPQAFTLEAAITVAGASSGTLYSLVDHSLLKQTEAGRFALHEIVRQYALDHLQCDSQTETQCRQRHAAYYSNLIEPDPEELMRTPAKLALVQQELSNLRVAWLWAVEERQLLPIMRLSQGIFLHFMAQGPLLEGWHLCNTVVELLRRWPTGTMNMDESRFFALAPAGLAYLGYYLGRHAEVTQLAHEAIARAQPLPDARALAMAYSIRGMVAFAQGENEEHETYCRTALTYARAEPVPYMIVVSLAFLALGLTVQGKVDEALAALHEALQLVHDQRLVYLEGYILSELGFVYAMTGDWALADGVIRQGLQLNQGLNNSLNRGYQYAHLALIAEAVGDYARAIAWTDETLAFNAISPDPMNQLSALLIRSRAIRQMGDLHGAEVALQQLLSIAQTLGRQAECAQAYIEQGHVALKRQAWQAAEAHYRAALEIFTAADLPVLAAAQAGLAQLYFQQGDLAAALPWVENSLDILLTQGFETQYDAAAALLACYQVLEAAHDPRATTLLQQAALWVEAQSLKISDETLRHSFLKNVPHHRQLLTLARPTGQMGNLVVDLTNLRSIDTSSTV